MIRVVIADDHRLLLEGLSQALDAIPDISVVGTADGGLPLVGLVEDRHPDVLLLDLDMPDLGGLEALRRMKRVPPAIVVTMHGDDEHRRQAHEAGAAAFMSKATPLPDLAAAVRAVAAGESLIDPASASEILSRHMDPVLDPGAAALTERERELLSHLASGLSRTQDLADAMFISSKTVKNHLANIYEKLAVQDRAQAAVEAIRLGLAGRQTPIS